MINISSLITKDIIDRHSNYIYNCGILKRLNELNKNWDTKLDSTYVSEYNHDMSSKLEMDELKADLEMLIKYFISDVENLNKPTIKSDNIFIASPKIIHEKLEKFELEYKISMDYMKWEYEQKKKNKKMIKPFVIDLIYNDFGYEKFSSLTISKSPYNSLIRSLKSCNGIIYNNIKKECYYINKGKRKVDLEKMKLEIISSLDKYSLNKKIFDCHKAVIEEVKGINTSKLNIKGFILKIVNIIKIYEKKCLKAFEELDVTVDNYRKLYDKNDDWSPYHYVMMIGLKTCPYCNRQYVTPAFNEKRGMLRADLDHFYPKSRYPYLSMSIFNLVPCCKFCNSSLKSDEDFNFMTHMNPFENGFHEQLKFRFIPKSYDLLNSKIEIVLEDGKCKNIQDEINMQKCKNNAETFKLKTLYSYHVEEVKELIRKRIVYSTALVQEVRNMLAENSISMSDEEIIEFLISNYIGEEKLHQKPLSKLYKDIVEQLNFKQNFKSDGLAELLSKEDIERLKQYVK